MSLESIPKHLKVKILQDRAEQLAKARLFFAERNVLEVDCPILSRHASVDTHIDLISAQYRGNCKTTEPQKIDDFAANSQGQLAGPSCADENMPEWAGEEAWREVASKGRFYGAHEFGNCLYTEKETHYLHSSPEYGMKRLLSLGMGDIYQLSHVFRDGEWSPKHNPEFTMAEWYRIGFSFNEMIEESFDFVGLFLGKIPTEQISYRDAFIKYAGIDYFNSSTEGLFEYLRKHKISTYAGIEEEGIDALLNLIMGIVIEPQLGKGKITALTHYPSSQAALAKTVWHEKEQVAERFEIYYEGVELANGYHELADASEQRLRLNEANEMRLILGKKMLPIDEDFLEALKVGLPDCCGVAIGFDRLMMLRHKTNQIHEVIPFGWSHS